MIVTIRPARTARAPYANAWHVADPNGGTLCNRNARTKPVAAITPFVTCAKCKTKDESARLAAAIADLPTSRYSR